MSFNWIAKVSACLVLSCSILTNSVRASNHLPEDDASFVEKLTKYFPKNDLDNLFKLKTTKEFYEWEEVLEKARIYAEKKYNYLKLLKQEEVETFFSQLADSQKKIKHETDYLKKLSELEVNVGSKENGKAAFYRASSALESLKEIHNNTYKYFLEKFTSFYEKKQKLSHYNETDSIKAFMDKFQVVEELVKKFSGNPSLHDDVPFLMNLTIDLIDIQELDTKLNSEKLVKRKSSSPESSSLSVVRSQSPAKRKDSSPAHVSPSNSKESPKSKKNKEEPAKHRERSKTLESIFSSKKKIDPKKEVSKQLAVQAQEKAIELQESVQSKNKKDETQAN